MATSGGIGSWAKPLKRSQKARLRKELEKRKKEEQNNLSLENGWKLTWEQIKELF